MNPQERELLNTFLQQMGQAQAGQKDAEADRLIREAVARQPDAAYLLVQRAMGLEYALQAAQEQLRSNTRSGFLDSPNSWGRTAPPAQVLAQTASQPDPVTAKPASSWGSGMLGTVATTAAGVVAGSFLFQGIQGLMGHHNAAANEPPLPPASKEGVLDSEDVADALDDTGDVDSGDTV